MSNRPSPPDAIHLDVPLSAAHIGPGYGVLGIAVDQLIRLHAEPTGDGSHSVEWLGEPDETTLDPRHDPLLRGLQLAAEAFEADLSPGYAIRVHGRPPRGVGLGVRSASVAAGIALAARLAGRQPTQQDCIAPLTLAGGNPTHGIASLFGGAWQLILTSPPGATTPTFTTVPADIWPGWRLVFALPELQLTTAEARRALPATISRESAWRTASRLAGLVGALQHGDQDLMAACLVDESHMPHRLRLLPGAKEAIAAAMAAGACGATFTGQGPALLAIAPAEANLVAVGKAMVGALAEQGSAARWQMMQVDHRGPMDRPGTPPRPD